ncbi:MAG: hypothetical protein F6K00_02310 [Leptolyngbya sp. SIOISBB]|nr:hypothetical protein [Leptolyngbya sp. SIOISBB]
MTQESVKVLTIGLRMTSDGQLSYFGLDDVNDMIAGGKRVIEIKEGDALMTKTETQDGKINLKLSGFSVTVLIDE